MTGALELLERIYDHRIELARDLAAAGTPVVGYVGADIPRSLVAAAGAAPLRLFGPASNLGDTSEAGEIIGRAVDAATTSILSSVLDGEFDFLSGILVSHDCQASVMLFYSLRELHRSGRITVPVHLVDLVHLDREPTLRFDVAQLARAAGTLADWTGRAVAKTALRSAMVESAEVDDALADLQVLRRKIRPAITGVDALHAFGVASALPATEAAAVLRSVIAKLPDHVETVPDLRLFFTGSSPRGDTVYRCIEQDGVVIVGEDHNWGDLGLTVRPHIPEDGADLDELFEALATALLAAAPAAPTSGQQARGRATREAVSASGAAALLSIVREQDEAGAWDFPHQSAQAGVLSVMLDRLPADLDAVVEEKLLDAISSLRSAS